MNQLKAERKLKRCQSTRTINEIVAELQNENPDFTEIQGNLDFLEELHEQLDILDRRIAEMMIEQDVSDQDQEQEYNSAADYKKKYLKIKRKVESRVPAADPVGSPPASAFSIANAEETTKRSFRLPEIKLKKFSGDLKDWLGFWSQFQKIDEDDTLHGSDKFHYLLQSLEPNTEAYDIVSNFTTSAENYPEVVQALKSRFGNEDLLLQVYVREMLKLVISNVNATYKIPFQALYLKLDSHLRTMKVLNLEQADPATWLFPLVESSLPEEILLTWQRSPLSTYDGSKDNPPRTRLDLMMDFLSKEVEIRRKIQLAQSGFRDDSSKVKKEAFKADNNNKKGKRESTPTLAGFHNAAYAACVFCNKPHESTECFIAQAMSLEQKIKILKEKKLCFQCFKSKHNKGSNECKVKMKCMLCGQKHYTIMCKKPDQLRNVKENHDEQTSGQFQKAITVKQPEVVENFTGCTNHVCSRSVALQTLMVTIVNGERAKTVRVFYDTGSQRSYVLKATAEELGLQHVDQECVRHSLFGGAENSAVVHLKYDLILQRSGGTYKCKLKVRDQINICNSIPRISKSTAQLFSELKARKIYITDVGDDCPPIELLLGADVYGRLLTGKVILLDCGISAVETKLGWTLCGEFKDGIVENNMCNLLISMTVQDASITQLWELDAIGVKDPTDVKSIAEQEIKVKGAFMKTIQRNKDGRYTVSLPWAEGHPALPSNREIAIKRLYGATRKLMEANQYQVYDRIFADWVSEGFIERVPTTELGKKSHYLPHRPVFKLTSLTTPVRPVFDASCKIGKAPSLNDCLIKGSNYVQMIPELLLRFREKCVGITSDIRKAFQMINVCFEDRDAMRFLWWNDLEKRELCEYRHIRVMFGATCSPFILGAVLEYHLTHASQEDSIIAKKLLESLDVDNCVTSENTTTEFELFREKSTFLLAAAQMELRMWMTNVDTIDDPLTRTISVLGTLWDRVDDTLSVNITAVGMPEVITKRAVLSTIQKVYDPVGVVCPALIPMKTLLQDVWITRMKWDEALPEKHATVFREWCINIDDLGKIRIPRMTTTAGANDRKYWSLHTFTDASKDAYSAVVFLRIETESEVNVQLLAAKSRVAPVKKVSIPRLELLGCLIGTRLAARVKKAMKLQDVLEIYWCDSSTALAWIRRDDQWATFVGNRVREICSTTPAGSWRHVPGTLNPADLPSRGCTPKHLLLSKWWVGPQWLREDQRNWPSSEAAANEEEVSEEIKQSATKSEVVASMTLLDIQTREYTFSQLTKIMGWIQRFIYNTRQKNAIVRNKGELSCEEKKNAEECVVKCIQREAFPKMQSINGVQVSVDHADIIRVKTRIVLRDDLVDFRYPVLLPSKHEIVRKLILEYHRNNCHAGVSYLMAKLRENDNGSNFVGANNLFKKLDWDAIQKEERIQPIQWKFNPPSAAWWGGWWERLIRTVKDLLKRTVGKATINRNELVNILDSVEEVMNNRPLTYLTEDEEDLEPLTPATFLRPNVSIKFPEGDLTEKQVMKLRYKYMKTLSEELKKRFVKEYLAQLVAKPETKLSRLLKIGDIVLVASEKKRIEWPLARIIEMYPGRDGLARVAKLMTKEGYLVRPVQRLYPLELDVIAATEIKTRYERQVKAPERMNLD